ncbi:MAG: hypothetical protein Q9M82_04740 [Mariprofundus sp.]|nr:hypothetical protein [Mariprofundus sp.]
MLTRKLHIRGCFRIVARLMAVMFAVQVVVGGFCLLTAEAHTMPVSVQISAMDAHCSKSMYTISNHEHELDHSGNCFHCDKPNELSSSALTSVASIVLVVSGVISLPVAPQFGSAATRRFSTRTPTGPPRSSSLLYTTTQRIRI